MNYTIYADVLFLEHTAVNLIVLYTASFISGIKIRFWKAASAASVAGIINIFCYLILFDANSILQIMVYAMTTLVMTRIFIRDRNIASLRNFFISILFSEFLVTGILTILLQHTARFPVYILIVLAVCIILRMIFGNVKEQRENQNYIHAVSIYMDDRKTEFMGFMDSGNLLKIPFSQKGVIIGDMQAMQQIMPQEFHDFTQTYLRTGDIDYDALMQIHSKWMIIPVTYGCINHKTGTMPGIICSKVILDNGEGEYSDVPICFSRMNLGNGYHMLLPKDLCGQNNEGDNRNIF